MDRRKKPLDVTASSVSAGKNDAAGSEFSAPPPDMNLDLDCFLIRGPRPGLPSNRNPDRASTLRHASELGVFSRLRISLSPSETTGTGLPASLVSLVVGEEC